MGSVDTAFQKLDMGTLEDTNVDTSTLLPTHARSVRRRFAQTSTSTTLERALELGTSRAAGGYYGGQGPCACVLSKSHWQRSNDGPRRMYSSTDHSSPQVFAPFASLALPQCGLDSARLFRLLRRPVKESGQVCTLVLTPACLFPL
jgi:hypothetical protein